MAKLEIDIEELKRLLAGQDNIQDDNLSKSIDNFGNSFGSSAQAPKKPSQDNRFSKANESQQAIEPNRTAFSFGDLVPNTGVGLIDNTLEYFTNPFSSQAQTNAQTGLSNIGALDALGLGGANENTGTVLEGIGLADEATKGGGFFSDIGIGDILAGLGGLSGVASSYLSSDASEAAATIRAEADKEINQDKIDFAKDELAANLGFKREELEALLAKAKADNIQKAYTSAINGLAQVGPERARALQAAGSLIQGAFR